MHFPTRPTGNATGMLSWNTAAFAMKNLRGQHPSQASYSLLAQLQMFGKKPQSIYLLSTIPVLPWYTRWNSTQFT